jgi:hypothetical protein
LGAEAFGAKAEIRNPDSMHTSAILTKKNTSFFVKTTHLSQNVLIEVITNLFIDRMGFPQASAEFIAHQDMMWIVGSKNLENMTTLKTAESQPGFIRDFN